MDNSFDHLAFFLFTLEGILFIHLFKNLGSYLVSGLKQKQIPKPTLKQPRALFSFFTLRSRKVVPEIQNGFMFDVGAIV
jgi:hypothetical protein